MSGAMGMRACLNLHPHAIHSDSMSSEHPAPSARVAATKRLVLSLRQRRGLRDVDPNAQQLDRVHEDENVRPKMDERGLYRSDPPQECGDDAEDVHHAFATWEASQPKCSVQLPGRYNSRRATS